MSEWKPIETAPRQMVTDRPRVMLYSASRNIYWTDCFQDAEGWVSRHRWVDEKGRRVLRFLLVDAPTHWMPLPNPPAENQQ